MTRSKLRGVTVGAMRAVNDVLRALRSPVEGRAVAHRPREAR